MQETQGQINISYMVYCPHCAYMHDDCNDNKWFDDTMGSDFPIDDGYKQDFDAVCKECNKPFTIKGFVH